MPEGPEIRQSADALANVLQNQKINKVTVGLESLKPFQSVLSGQRVTQVSCRGKAMLLHFDNDLSIYSHNQLYGRWVIVPCDELPETNRSLRLGLHTRTHSALLYSASDISVWPREKLSEHPFLRKLGPDLLNQAVTPEAIQQRLTSKRFRNRSLAALYLDQGFLAGMGNYLRSEILFFAGIHPDKKVAHLSDKQINHLAEQTLQVTYRSYETAGYTTSIAASVRARHSAAEYEAQRFMVFDREGQPCRRCNETILRAERSSRRIYFCPQCQVIG
ncbi:MAG: endonuclease VIII [Pseudomonadota bacterium]|uniref:DNA-(apurinic or apyrimidinic site) lyase n=1 Tax=Alteromonas alba TaxID=2079529 RepID=A0A2S9V9I6_9ALTE|nr:endonuclease VIII [Alteromonas alba]MDY6929294.1 endonuclease VIII [Pseudomonadota bacterium]PRO73137.1 endonuclease VIII [Alteromonas alba]